MSELYGVPRQVGNSDLHASYSEEFTVDTTDPRISEIAPTGLLEDPTPILLSPGLRNRSDKLLPVLNEFANHNRVAIGIEHSLNDMPVGQPEFADALRSYPAVEVKKAAALFEVIKSKNLERVDLIGYCEGAVNGSILASLFPNLVRNFIVINPASMIGPDDNFSRVAKIFIKKSVDDVRFALPLMLSHREPELVARKMSASWDRIAGLPTLHKLSRLLISEQLVDLEQKGIKVGVLQSRRDSLYPYEMVYRNVPEAISAHATFSNQKLGHAALLSSPEFTVKAVIQLIKSLNNTRELRQPEPTFKLSTL